MKASIQDKKCEEKLSKRIKREWQKNCEKGLKTGKGTGGMSDRATQVCGHEFCEKLKK